MQPLADRWPAANIVGDAAAGTVAAMDMTSRCGEQCRGWFAVPTAGTDDVDAYDTAVGELLHEDCAGLVAAHGLLTKDGFMPVPVPFGWTVADLLNAAATGHAPEPLANLCADGTAPALAVRVPPDEIESVLPGADIGDGSVWVFFGTTAV